MTPRECDYCMGLGWVDIDCPRCDGSGDDEDGGECEYCLGNGTIEEICYECSGEGIWMDL